MGALLVRWVGGWIGDPGKSRYGCSLPGLTGLASHPSATNLPGQTICHPAAWGKRGIGKLHCSSKVIGVPSRTGRTTRTSRHSASYQTSR